MGQPHVVHTIFIGADEVANLTLPATLTRRHVRQLRRYCDFLDSLLDMDHAESVAAREGTETGGDTNA